MAAPSDWLYRNCGWPLDRQAADGIAIRPETIKIVEDGEPNGDGDRLSGQIRQVMFDESLTEYAVDIG